MRGFVVSRGGTFGTVHREYTSDTGVLCVVIAWGPLGWLTPVPASDIRQLESPFESEARIEADAAWPEVES